MKCLSVRQPWAALIVAGLKDMENRSWEPRYRGRILIHAGAGMRVSDLDYLAEKYGIEVDRSSLVLGAILGAVDLIDCKKKVTSRWHRRGQIGWYFANPRRLRSPIPYKGQLGLFEVPDRLLPKSWQR
ncbi:MAG: ASCH domain-containing protein [Planctomycetota bacterium]|nr:ASCH domain-containing protein [Planctomycetota bacterium]